MSDVFRVVVTRALGYFFRRWLLEQIGRAARPGFFFRQLAVVAQALLLLRMPAQCEQTVAYQIGGRLVAGQQQQYYESEQLVFAERVGLVARGY